MFLGMGKGIYFFLKKANQDKKNSKAKNIIL